MKRALRNEQLSIIQPDRSGETPKQRLYRIGWNVSENGCWEWSGSKRGHGYGAIWIGSQKTAAAHRVSYEVHHGPIPNGLVVMHSCDNPPCINPAHLSVGTVADNIADMIAKGRANLSGLHARRSVAAHTDGAEYRNPAARLTAEDVSEFRRLFDSGTSLIELRRQFGISKSQALRIAHRRAWQNIA